MAANPGGYYWWKQNQAAQAHRARQQAEAAARAAETPKQRELRKQQERVASAMQQEHDKALLIFRLQNMLIAALYAIPAAILGAYNLPTALLFVFGISGTVLLTATSTRIGLRFLFRRSSLRGVFGFLAAVCPPFALPLFLLGAVLRRTRQPSFVH